MSLLQAIEQCEKEISELKKEIATLRHDLGNAESAARMAIAASETFEKRCNSQQAKIDSLMIEFCPDEMTDDQISEYSINQKEAEHPYA
jgi:cell division septum initiation protein DivIVA